MFVFYPLSFLHPQSPPVRLVGKGAHEASKRLKYKSHCYFIFLNKFTVITKEKPFKLDVTTEPRGYG
jgi:hypothetical protein